MEAKHSNRCKFNRSKKKKEHFNKHDKSKLDKSKHDDKKISNKNYYEASTSKNNNYKPNTTLNVPDEVANTSQKYTKRSIVNSWNREELPEYLGSDHDDIEGFDINELVNSNCGQHFMLQEEQKWMTESEKYKNEGAFKLDLLRLEASMSLIPFYERQGLSEKSFSPEEIQVMKLEAKNNESKIKVEEDIDTYATPIMNEVSTIDTPFSECEMDEIIFEVDPFELTGDSTLFYSSLESDDHLPYPNSVGSYCLLDYNKKICNDKSGVFDSLKRHNYSSFLKSPLCLSSKDDETEIEKDVTSDVSKIGKGFEKFVPNSKRDGVLEPGSSLAKKETSFTHKIGSNNLSFGVNNNSINSIDISSRQNSSNSILPSSINARNNSATHLDIVKSPDEVINKMFESFKFRTSVELPEEKKSILLPDTKQCSIESNFTPVPIKKCVPSNIKEVQKCTLNHDDELELLLRNHQSEQKSSPVSTELSLKNEELNGRKISIKENEEDNLDEWLDNVLEKK